MKVSIVTISYNQAAFLERSLKSIISQDYNDIEYIVVDAGSSDESRKIIEKYRNMVKKIIFEPDGGPAEGLNKGFKFATGEIFGFLNSDDVLMPGTITKVVDFFKRRQNIDVVSAGTILIDEKDKQLRKLYSDKFSLVRYAYGANFIAQQSTFFRKKLFRSVGGFNQCNQCAWDGELLVDIAIAGGRFALVRDFWSEFRSHPNTITSSGKLDHYIKKYNERIFEKIMNRKFRYYDRALKLYYKCYRYFLNPYGVIERLRKGPVYGRHRK